MQISVIVDNTPPNNITINPVIYQRGSAANNRRIIGFSASADDPLINGVSSGIRNASLNASVFNTTGWIALTNNSGFWIGNVKSNSSPGIVYKNLNIWVGTSGFATPKNIQKGVISFRVQNSWLKNSGVTGNDVRMVKWDGIKWLQIETIKRKCSILTPKSPQSSHFF